MHSTYRPLPITSLAAESPSLDTLMRLMELLLTSDLLYDNASLSPIYGTLLHNSDHNSAACGWHLPVKYSYRHPDRRGQIHYIPPLSYCLLPTRPLSPGDSLVKRAGKALEISTHQR